MAEKLVQMISLDVILCERRKKNGKVDWDKTRVAVTELVLKQYGKENPSRRALRIMNHMIALRERHMALKKEGLDV